mgnify:CR=1 FL=1
MEKEPNFFIRYASSEKKIYLRIGKTDWFGFYAHPTVLLESLKRLNSEKLGLILFCCSCGDVGCGSAFVQSTVWKDRPDLYQIKYRTVGCKPPVYASMVLTKKEFIESILEFEKSIASLAKEKQEWPFGEFKYESMLREFNENLNNPNESVGDWAFPSKI